VERVEVTHQMVTLAKSFIVTNFEQFVSTMLQAFLKQQDATLVQPVALWRQTRRRPTLRPRT